ncbi:MAG TPA: hypothetical protein VF169_28055 [Albitalea sp.]|uniref:hypothetical protein n=1 Tax=Piscinibacter sp. TaxID=1903157 RepID=UPI002ED55818
MLWLALFMLAGPARADLAAVSPTGFTITHRHALKATPQQAIEAVGRVDRWWNGDHTYSGNPANLRLEPVAGGCFCERWDGGSVQHAQVLYVGKDAVVRLQGALGPLQELPVVGILTFAAATGEGKTVLTVTYRVAGPGDIGLEKWAGAVDKVIGEQAARLASFVDKGKP